MDTKKLLADLQGYDTAHARRYNDDLTDEVLTACGMVDQIHDNEGHMEGFECWPMANVDDAMRLLPEGWEVSHMIRNAYRRWDVGIKTVIRLTNGMAISCSGSHAELPVALCIAAINARMTRLPEGVS